MSRNNWIESLEGRQFLSVAPMGGTPARVRGADAPGVMIQQRDRDRVNDGSCQAATTVTTTAAASGDTVQSRTQLQSQTRAQSQVQTRDQLSDQLRDQIRDRLRDGSCKA